MSVSKKLFAFVFFALPLLCQTASAGGIACYTPVLQERVNEHFSKGQYAEAMTQAKDYAEKALEAIPNHGIPEELIPIVKKLAAHAAVVGRGGKAMFGGWHDFNASYAIFLTLTNARNRYIAYHCLQTGMEWLEEDNRDPHNPYAINGKSQTLVQLNAEQRRAERFEGAARRGQKNGGN